MVLSPSDVMDLPPSAVDKWGREKACGRREESLCEKEATTERNVICPSANICAFKEVYDVKKMQKGRSEWGKLTQAETKRAAE